ncbi:MULTISPECIES: ATP-grasp domain-containing protein [Frankia]|uniref:ATP-grasp domain-containing protein n=1 Tax=Frankia TaxID=1854 RepID=UPI0003129677|nr:MULTISPECIES: ATP-grasp domain-containing protein [Frankia]
MSGQARVAVVDGHSTGRALVAALTRRGASCVHVQSSEDMPAFFTDGFDPTHYEACLTGAGDPARLAGELAALGVTSVVAGTESGVVLADILAHHLGLDGNHPATSAARRDKATMGRAAAEAGLTVPRTWSFTDADEARTWYARRRLTDVVVKPPSSAGSDNVWFCRTPDEVRTACTRVLAARNLYREPNPTVLVQERLRGVEYYANTVSHAGRHRIVEVWRYSKRLGPDRRPVYDHEDLVPAGSEESAPLRDFVPAVLDALGVRHGAAHTEVMITNRGPVLVESGARLGGGTLPWVVEKYCGVSQTSLLAESLLDPDRVAAFDDRTVRSLGALRNIALISRTAGTVRSLEWAARLEELPTFVALSHHLRPGEHLGATIDLPSSPGFVYLAASDPQAVDRDYRQLRALEETDLYLT